MTEVQPTSNQGVKESIHFVKYIHVVVYGATALVATDGTGQLPCTETPLGIPGLIRKEVCEFRTKTEKYVVLHYQVTGTLDMEVAIRGFSNYGNYRFERTDNPQTKRIMDIVDAVKSYVHTAAQENRYHSGDGLAPKCPQKTKGEIIQILPDKLVILVRWLGGDVKILPINTVEDLKIGQHIIVDATRYHIS